jgi:hypothetical protein
MGRRWIGKTIGAGAEALLLQVKRIGVKSINSIDNLSSDTKGIGSQWVESRSMNFHPS